jgi:hypothetical protein
LLGQQEFLVLHLTFRIVALHWPVVWVLLKGVIIVVVILTLVFLVIDFVGRKK